MLRLSQFKPLIRWRALGDDFRTVALAHTVALRYLGIGYDIVSASRSRWAREGQWHRLIRNRVRIESIRACGRGERKTSRKRRYTPGHPELNAGFNHLKLYVDPPLHPRFTTCGVKVWLRRSVAVDRERRLWIKSPHKGDDNDSS